MTRTEHLLVCLGEECNEVAKRASKALRFGLSEVQEGQRLTNAQRILEEYADLVAIVQILESEGVLKFTLARNLLTLTRRKRAKFEKYLAYSRRMGR